VKSTPVTTVTLRALAGEPLTHEPTREMVLATARAIAERQGVGLLRVEASASSVTATLEAGRFEAIGFAAELRRLTTRWYTSKFGAETLWGEPDTRPDPETLP
jgi:hypothetical protein